MYTLNFEDAFIVSGISRSPHVTKSEILFANISYMLDFLKGGTSLRGVYSSSDSYFIQNDVQQYSVSMMQQLSFNVYSSPISLLNIDYTFSFTNNSFQLKGNNSQSTNTMHQKLSLTIIPVEKLNLVVIGNHYLNTLESGNKNTYLLDTDMNYRLSSNSTSSDQCLGLFNSNGRIEKKRLSPCRRGSNNYRDVCFQNDIIRKNQFNGICFLSFWANLYLCAFKLILWQ